MRVALGRFKATAVLGLVLALLATLVSVVGTSAPARAAPSGSTFQPGYIVSDANFFNDKSMTVAQIQSFLEAKGPTTCNGCLKEYRANTYDRAADPKRCTAALTGKTDISAAEMIYDVSQACHINPMTLLVTLQKETSLVTMSAPESWRYSRAMGYGCPDSAPCSTSYYGLFIQLYSAASQLNYYGYPGSSFTWYPVGTWTPVRYSPNATCGAAAVYLQNRATAALYYYTPYQPNTAALTNLYGTGDSCSAYGNRNFWRTWWDWFGDPTGGVATPIASHAPSASPSLAPSPSASPSTATTTTTTTTTTSSAPSPTTTTPTTPTTPTTTTTTTAPPTVVSYTVVPGDTMSKIAAKFNTTVAAIAAANAIKNVNLIYVGQKLTIPAGGGTPTTTPSAPAPTPTTTTPAVTTPPPPPATTPPPAAANTTVTYTVVAGDTLGTIAATFHTTVAAIAAANGIANVNFIRVGQKLTVAGFGTTGTTTTTTPATPPPPAAGAGTTVTYTVVAGDSLSKIAASYHTTVAAIAIANKIKNVNLIRVGQKLTITAG